jgi:putative ABC transport system permease protein
MSFALATLWHERNRYLPAVLAVAFSAVLIALQGGMLLGLLTDLATSIEHSSADVWVGYPGVPSSDTGVPIPERWKARLEADPDVERVESYVRGQVLWGKRQGGVELCAVIGTELHDQAMGVMRELTPELRARLVKPGSIIVDELELPVLGLSGVGDVAEVNGCRLELVGTVRGLNRAVAVYVFCSIATARELLRLPADRVTYLLARCRPPAAAPAVARRLRAYDMAAFTSQEWAQRTRAYWLTKTRAGIALGLAALLGLLVGATVTAQTLYAATAAALRQYAVLEALGIPTARMAGMVLTQALWVGGLGLALGLGAALGVAPVVRGLGARLLLPPGLLFVTAAVTLAVALLSGLFALRSLRGIEPTALLR